jgi:hypothetical protein
LSHAVPRVIFDDVEEKGGGESDNHLIR